MSDEVGGDKKKGGGKKWLLIFLVLILLLGGGAFALKQFAPGLIPGWGQKKASTDGSEAGKQLGELYPMKSFIVNLVDPSGKRYLKVTLSLELDTPEVKPELETRLIQIRDAVLVLLSSKSYDDIDTTEGKSRLRTEIINRCNAYLSKGRINNVYFSEFVIQ